MDLRQKPYAINRIQLLSFTVREFDRDEEGIIYPLKVGHERVNTTLTSMKVGEG